MLECTKLRALDLQGIQHGDNQYVLIDGPGHPLQGSPVRHHELGAEGMQVSSGLTSATASIH